MSPIQFKPFFKRISETTGIESQTQLASFLDVNRSAITQAKRNNSVPAKWVLHLSRKFGLNPDWIETGTGRKFIIDNNRSAFETIPKVEARLCAGNGSFDVGEDIQGFYSFERAWLKKKGNSMQMVLMDIFGNSMEPELKDGDTVLVDQSQKAVLAGAIYAVGIDDTVMIKRLEKHPNKLVLRSDNEAYAPLFLQGSEMETVRIIGKVIWICRELR